MRSSTITVAGAVALVGLLLLGIVEWQYIQDGYRLAAGIEGGPWSSHDVQIPLWRKVVTWVILLVAATGISLSVMTHRSAVIVLGSAFGIRVVVGILDVREYGTMGSPTSLQAVALLLALFAGAVYWKKIGILR